MRLLKPLAGLAGLALVAAGVTGAGRRDLAAEHAIAKAIPLMQSTSEFWSRNIGCYSCHHNGLATMAVASAKLKGIAVDDAKLAAQFRFTKNIMSRSRESLVDGLELPGHNERDDIVQDQYISVGYRVFTLSFEKVTQDPSTAAAVRYYLKNQMDEGRWPTFEFRPPFQASQFTSTALAIFLLKNHAPSEFQKESAQKIKKAVEYLVAMPAMTLEDKAYKLLGLSWAGAEKSAIAEAKGELVADQRDDGGWAQEFDMKPDAYATGLSLFALHRGGGLSVKDPVYERGVKFLLDTQQPDGTWQVQTHSRPIQRFLETGFPGGKHQFISITATSWAIIAISQTL